MELGAKPQRVRKLNPEGAEGMSTSWSIPRVTGKDARGARHQSGAVQGQKLSDSEERSTRRRTTEGSASESEPDRGSGRSSTVRRPSARREPSQEAPGAITERPCSRTEVGGLLGVAAVTVRPRTSTPASSARLQDPGSGLCMLPLGPQSLT